MNKETAIAEWRRGLTSLASADVLARAGQYEDAVVTSYYAIFHAAKAALAVHEIETSTHAGVRSMFGLHLVKPGNIEPEWAADLGLSLEDRVKADYNVFAHLSEEDAGYQQARATAFLQRIRNYLLLNGLAEDETPAGPAIDSRYR